jgi:hypothetical protein
MILTLFFMQSKKADDKSTESKRRWFVSVMWKECADLESRDNMGGFKRITVCNRTLILSRRQPFNRVSFFTVDRRSHELQLLNSASGEHPPVSQFGCTPSTGHFSPLQESPLLQQ